MGNISLEYWNELSSQFLLINSLLAGFSITLVATLLVHEYKNRFIKMIFYASVLAVFSFIISVFGNIGIKMMTTKGYPLELSQSRFTQVRVFTAISFVVGIFSVLFSISVSGWVKSKRAGWFTTILGIIATIIIFILS